jgi:hypothetical protein
MAALKLYYQGEVRRLSALPPTFAELSSLACNLFQVKTPSFKYVDEENDEITVESQTEYSEALRLLKLGAFKLVVVERSELLSLKSSFMTGQLIANLPLEESQLLSSDIEQAYVCSEVPSSSQGQTAAVGADRAYVVPSSLARASIQQSLPITNTDEEVKDRMPSGLSLKSGSRQDYNPVDLKASIREILQAELAHQINAPPLRQEIAKFHRACSVCMTNPEGILYSCMTCRSFCMCSACEEICTHPHPLFKVRRFAQLDALPRPVLLNCSPLKPLVEMPIKPAPPVPRPQEQKPLPDPKVKKPDVPFQQEPLENKIKIFNDMGFFDRAKIIDALIAHKSSLEETLNFLLAH